jgi:hypothetical protein
MALIRHKRFPEEVYEVYGAREYEYPCCEEDYSWREHRNEFLIYSYSSWGWVNSDDYEPVKD